MLKRHFIRLNSMMLVNLIESFERFLKELATVCVDHVAEFVLDKRFEEFQVKGSVLAAHFRQGTLGKSLAWLVSFHLEPQLKGAGVVFGERATRGEIVWPQTNRPRPILPIILLLSSVPRLCHPCYQKDDKAALACDIPTVTDWPVLIFFVLPAAQHLCQLAGVGMVGDEFVGRGERTHAGASVSR